MHFHLPSRAEARPNPREDLNHVRSAGKVGRAILCAWCVFEKPHVRGNGADRCVHCICFDFLWETSIATATVSWSDAGGVDDDCENTKPDLAWVNDFATVKRTDADSSERTCDGHLYHVCADIYWNVPCPQMPSDSYVFADATGVFHHDHVSVLVVNFDRRSLNDDGEFPWYHATKRRLDFAAVASAPLPPALPFALRPHCDYLFL